MSSPISDPQHAHETSQETSTAQDEHAIIAAHVTALQSPDWATSSAAATELTREGTRGVAALVDVLADAHSSAEARHRAAIALGQTHDPSAVVPLAAALRDPGDRVLRMSAAIALGMLGAPEGVLPLVEALGDPALAWTPTPLYAIVRLGTVASDPLLAALSSPNPCLRGQAAEALGRLKEPRALEPFRALLQEDPDARVRWAAVDGLRGLGDRCDRHIARSVLTALQDPDVEVRISAIDRLANWGDATAHASLEHLRDHDHARNDDGDEVSETADWAIGRLQERLAAS
jgi:HEAT repeat protein